MCMCKRHNSVTWGAGVAAAGGCQLVKTHLGDTKKGEVGKDVSTLFVKAKQWRAPLKGEPAWVCLLTPPCLAPQSLQSSATLWQWHSPVCLASLSFISFFFVTQLTRNSSKIIAHLCLSSLKANDLQISSTSRQVRVRTCKSSHSAWRFVLVKVLVKDVSCWLQITEPLSLTQNLSAALAKVVLGLEIWGTREITYFQHCTRK